MSERITRRAVLAAASALGIGAVSIARGEPVYMPPQLPLSVGGLLKIGDDENAVMDALTYQMCRTPSMQDILNASPMYEKTDGKGVPIDYAVYFYDIAPFGFGRPLTKDAADIVDKLALLFACDVVNRTGGAYRNAINAAALAKQLNDATRSAAAIAQSNEVYRDLMLATRPERAPGSPSFARYDLTYGQARSRLWGQELANTLVSDGFITTVLARPIELGRHELCVQCYKLAKLAPDSVAGVLKRWRAPDLANTAFPLAAGDPWPPNYYDQMRIRDLHPLEPFINKAMNVKTTVDLGRKRKPLKKPRDVYVDVYGEAVWDMLKDSAGPAGLLANPQYPEGI